MNALVIIILNLLCNLCKLSLFFRDAQESSECSPFPGLHFMALLLEISSAALVKSQVQVQKAPWSSVKCSQFLMAKCTLIQNLHIPSASASARISAQILLRIFKNSDVVLVKDTLKDPNFFPSGQTMVASP